MKKEQEQDPKRAECSKKITDILDEYGFTLGVVGFTLVPKE